LQRLSNGFDGYVGTLADACAASNPVKTPDATAYREAHEWGAHKPVLWWTLRQLRSRDVHLRLRAIQRLGRSRSPRALDALLGLRCDENEFVRRAAALALGGTRDSRAREPLAAMLTDASKSVRAGAAEGLRLLGDPGAVGALQAALGDADGSVRDAAARALDALGWEPRDETERARYLAARAEWEEVAKVGRAAVEWLLVLFERPRSELVAWENRHLLSEIAHTLGRIGDPRAVEALTTALYGLANLETGLAEAAAEALGDIGAPAVEPLIAAMEKHPDQAVSIHAGRALGRTGDVRVVPVLLAALRDPKIALAAIGGIAALLKSASAKVDAADLTTLARLPDVIYLAPKAGEVSIGTDLKYGIPMTGQVWFHEEKTFDCTAIRARAQLELKRRGLKT
jgi:HEAT repeat protein